MIQSQWQSSHQLEEIVIFYIWSDSLVLWCKIVASRRRYPEANPFTVLPCPICITVFLNTLDFEKNDIDNTCNASSFVRSCQPFRTKSIT